MSRTRLRKNLSNSDLHDDNRSESDDDSSAESRVNPWSNKLHNEDFNITKKCGKINQFLIGQSRQLRKSCNHKIFQKIINILDFIVLDNVIASYKLPCILDLNMGTQIWYPGDSEGKKRRHEEKSSRTTSKSMGLRLQGLQLYNSSKSSWSYKNKYHGRDFDNQKLIETVQKFINEAPQPIRNNIAQVIKIKLYELRLVFYKKILSAQLTGLISSLIPKKFK